jgi:hypothetical protein
VPVSEVAAAFNVSAGQVQSLQDKAGEFFLQCLLCCEQGAVFLLQPCQKGAVF